MALRNRLTEKAKLDMQLTKELAGKQYIKLVEEAAWRVVYSELPRSERVLKTKGKISWKGRPKA